MEIKNKLTVTKGEVGGGKRGEGASQGTCIEDPWAQTLGWRLMVGYRGEGGWARRKEQGKCGTTVTEQQ